MPNAKLVYHLCAAERRIGEMAVVCEILAGQIKREASELERIRAAAFDAGEGTEPVSGEAGEASKAVAYEISGDMVQG